MENSVAYITILTNSCKVLLHTAISEFFIVKSFCPIENDKNFLRTNSITCSKYMAHL